MGVSSTTNTVIYSGDGSSVSFPFSFYFFQTTDLFVYIYDTVAGTIVQKTLGVDFSVSGTPNAQGLYPNGANVIMGSAPSSTKYVVISRTPLEEQDYSLDQNGLISSTAIVQQFDYLTLLVQSLQDQINRCVKLPAGFAPDFDTNLPAVPVADDYLALNSSADGLTYSAAIAGPTGPQGPPGADGTGALVVNPISTDTTLAVGSPVNEQYIPVDASAGDVNATLPLANVGAVGQLFQIKQVDSSGNLVNILPNGSDQILSTSLVGSLLLDYQGKSFSLVCRAAGFWDVI